MPVQFYMRGYDTVATQYVDWVVNDEPDTAGTYSGVNPANLDNIVINRTVTSKLNNFLKPYTPGFININTTYGPYLFHLNSYDWLHPTATALDPAIPVPSNPVGIAVNRGTTDNNFPEPTPREFATLFWDEGTGSWNFGFMDPTGTITSNNDTKTGNLSVMGTVTVFQGGTPASSGAIKLANSAQISARNSIDTFDLTVISTDSSDRVVLGDASTPVYYPYYQVSDSYIAESSFAGGMTTNTATTGFIRLKNFTPGIKFRAAANDANIVSTDAIDQLYIGDEYNNKIIYNTSATGTHVFRVNSISTLEVNSFGLTFNADLFNPTINQTTQITGNGQNLSIDAQSSTDLASYGGSVLVNAGTGTSGDGYVDIRSNDVVKLRIYSNTTPVVTDFTQNSILDPNSILSFQPTIRFYNTLSTANIKFDPIDSAFTSGNTLTVLGQENVGINGTGGNLNLEAGGGSGLNGVGGTLNLSSGTGTISNGTVNIKAGANTVASFTDANHNYYVASGGSFQFAINSNPVVEIVDNKLATLYGRRKNVSLVDVNYNVSNDDEFIAVDTLTNTSAITVTLPASPSTGDFYIVKDTTGSCNTYNITIQGNGNNIDGSGSLVLNTNYASVSLIFDGAGWNKI